MSTKTLSLFITPSEFFGALERIASELNLQFVREFPQNRGWEPISLAAAGEGDDWRFYLGSKSVVDGMPQGELAMARYGLVACDRPDMADGDTLIMTVLAAKSDWADANDKSHENDAGLKLVEKFKRRLRPILRNPVWAMNIVSKRQAVAYRGVWISEGAAAWSTRGGRLKQRAVANVEFFPSDPAGV